MDYIWFLLQATPVTVDTVLGEILKVGGIVSLILAAISIVVWKEYKAEKKIVAELNASIRKDAIDNLRIIDGLTNKESFGRQHDGRMMEMMQEALALLRQKEEKKIKDS